LARAEVYSHRQLNDLGLNPDRLPQHVAIIMDGNGRWAQSRGLPRIEGHRQGVNSVRKIVEECARLGLKQLTLYCFSTENWKRPETELDLLMTLLRRFVIEERERIVEQGLQFLTIGRQERLGKQVLKEISITKDASSQNDGMILCLALNYGSRDEIVDAVRSIANDVRAGKQSVDEIDQQTISDALYTSGMVDPDLVIRTAGEMRVSNFLLWQISYAELFVTDTCWPDFREDDLHTALKSYAARDRRFGGLTK
jgi:undecaprenyl diphosphate synthase